MRREVGQLERVEELGLVVGPLVEALDVRGESPSLGPPSSSPARIADVIDISTAARPTGLPEVDRVLGGGFVPGSVTLVGGEPGIGKSTLLLQLVGATAAAGVTSLYVSGEESAGQVRSRADRLDAVQDALWLVSETALPHIMTHIDKVQPEIVVIDSIQTLQEVTLRDFGAIYERLAKATDLGVAEIVPGDAVLTRGTQAYAKAGGRLAGAAAG